MIICPSCNHEEPMGALFCSECGTPLRHLEVSPTETMIVENEALREQADQDETTADLNNATSQAGKIVSIKILETGQVIPLEDSEEFILGRVGGKQPILPDIDLTPYGAYEAGVSRLHAIIKVLEGHVTITDLGSANGTLINGNKIIAHNPYPLENGDFITLGKFKALILIE